MNRLLLGVTKFQLRIYGVRFKALTVAKHPNGHEEEVAVLTKGAILGVTDVANAIGFYELVLQTEKLLNWAIVHEVTHKKELYTLRRPLIVLLALALWFALGRLGPLVAFFVWCASWWFTEFRAECQAIRTLGIQAVLEAQRNYVAVFKPPTLIYVLGGWGLHPPESLVIRICRLLNKDVQ